MTEEFELRDALGYGDLPEQIAEQMRRFPHGLEQIGALIVDGTDLAMQGRWAGEPRPHAWHPAWSGDASVLRNAVANAAFEAGPHRRDRGPRRRQRHGGRRIASCAPLMGYRP